MVDVDVTGKTTFRFRYAAANQVFLVGDFSRWQTDHLPMRQAAPHEWVLMMRLPPGTYEFRYLADGQWFTDFAAFGVTRNQFHDWNSVLHIPKVRPAQAQAPRPRIRRDSRPLLAQTA